MGWEGEILIDEEGKNNTFVGRNYCYKPIIVEGKLNLGDRIKVKVGHPLKKCQGWPPHRFEWRNDTEVVPYANGIPPGL